MKTSKKGKRCRIPDVAPGTATSPDASIFVGGLVYAPKPNGHYARAVVTAVDPQSRLVHVDFLGDDFLLSDTAVPFFTVVPCPAASCIDSPSSTLEAPFCSFLSQRIANQPQKRVRSELEDGDVCLSDSGREDVPQRRREDYGLNGDSNHHKSRPSHEANGTARIHRQRFLVSNGGEGDVEGSTRSTLRYDLQVPSESGDGGEELTCCLAYVSWSLAKMLDDLSRRLVQLNLFSNPGADSNSNSNKHHMTALVVFEDWMDLSQFVQVITQAPIVVDKRILSGARSVAHSTATVVMNNAGMSKYEPTERMAADSQREDHDSTDSCNFHILWILVMSDEWVGSAAMRSLVEHLGNQPCPSNTLFNTVDALSCLSAVVSIAASSAAGKSASDAEGSSILDHNNLSQFQRGVVMIADAAAALKRSRRLAPGIDAHVNWIAETTSPALEPAMATIRIPLTAEQMSMANRMLSSSTGSQMSLVSKALAFSFVSDPSSGSRPRQRSPLVKVLLTLLKDLCSSVEDPRVLVLDECASTKTVLQSTKLRYFLMQMKKKPKKSSASKRELKQEIGDDEDHEDDDIDIAGCENVLTVTDWIDLGGALRIPVSSPSRRLSPAHAALVGICVARADFVIRIRATVNLSEMLPHTMRPPLLAASCWNEVTLCPDICIQTCENGITLMSDSVWNDTCCSLSSHHNQLVGDDAVPTIDSILSAKLSTYSAASQSLPAKTATAAPRRSVEASFITDIEQLPPSVFPLTSALVASFILMRSA